MFLKSIEFSGFKSFAEKTKLEFGDGVTGIVGPNGSGKSNISDAIKWVLGEQSAKTLRGTKMEDVIFNGTVSRRATAMAEIILTFDNSKNVLPLDYSEITVTRRLFRTGESEYMINKSPVRLKDVRDLFLDTGIGTDSYSMMAQGNIDAILQSKPEERRYIFEEVAGVSKYKVRREEALRKLEKIGQDMLRLNDILSELGAQKNKLDSQARKAKQYRKYVEELKVYEVNSLVKRYKELKEKGVPLAAEQTRLNDEFLKLTADIDKLDAGLSLLKMSLAAKEEELINKRTEANNIASAIQIYTERIKSAESGRTESLKRDEESKAELAQGQAELKIYEEEKQRIAAELVDAEKTVDVFAQSFREKAQKKWEFEKELKAVETEIELSKNDIINLAQQSAEIKNRLSVFDSEIKGINGRLEKLEIQKKENAVQKAQKEDAFAQFDIKHSGMAAELAGLESDVKALSEAKKSAEEKIKLLQPVLIDGTSLISQIGAKIETILEDSDFGVIRKVKDKFAGRVCGTVAELITVRDDFRTLVQSALGERSEYIIVEDSAAAFEIIEWLKAEKMGWMAIVVLSEMNKIRTSDALSFNGRPLADYVLCDKKYESTVKYLLDGVSIQNGSVCSSGIIMGGDISKIKITGLERMNLLKNLNSELAAAESKNESIKSEIKSAEFEIESSGVKISETYNLINLKKNDIASSLTQMSVAKEGLKSVTGYMKLLSGEETNLNNQKIEIQSKTVEFNANLADKEKEKYNGDLRHEELKKRFAAQNELIKKIEEEINEQKIDFSVKNTQFQHLKEKNEIIDKNTALSREKIAKAEKWLMTSANKVAEYDKTMKDSQDEINRIVVSKDSIDTAVKTVERERDELKNGIAESENNIKNLRKSQSLIQDDLRSAERQIAGSTSEIRQIEDRLLGDKGIKIEDAVNSYQEISIPAEEVERIKKKIEVLGAVNLAAPEEYEQLESRFNFLSKQKADLETARDDLYTAINKINMTTRLNFQTTFTQVRENFRKIFSQLFEGGEADMILTDEGNLLETGIDIIAQPPGKKLQNIYLLSGGERSLTAIALLFAIYMIKPAPFCILDEIDGALDEANVMRFTRMLKGFAETSQFFIITHNKRTLEIANMLYGVAMEEPGISKVLSVNLEKVEEQVSVPVSA